MKEGTSFYLMSGNLIAIAQDACAQCKTRRGGKLVDPPVSDDSDAVVAIMFAAASLEAFVSDAAYMATIGLNDNMKRLAVQLEEAEGAKMQVKEKVRLFKAIVGEPFNAGKYPFQDFSLLVRVRNAIVHMKPDIVGDEVHDITQQMAQKKLCLLGNQHQDTWLSQISTAEVARWACNVAADIVAALAADEATLATLLRSAHFHRVD